MRPPYTRIYQIVLLIDNYKIAIKYIWHALRGEYYSVPIFCNVCILGERIVKWFEMEKLTKNEILTIHFLSIFSLKIYSVWCKFLWWLRKWVIVIYSTMINGDKSIKLWHYRSILSQSTVFNESQFNRDPVTAETILVEYFILYIKFIINFYYVGTVDYSGGNKSRLTLVLSSAWLKIQFSYYW